MEGQKDRLHTDSDNYMHTIEGNIKLSKELTAVFFCKKQ